MAFHYLAQLHDESISEKIGAAAVEAILPRLYQEVPTLANSFVSSALPLVQKEVPTLADSFVSSALPLVQQRLTELEPRLHELAVSSSQAVLGDPQIREVMRGTISDSAEKAEVSFRKGLIALGVTMVAANAAIAYVFSRRR